MNYLNRKRTPPCPCEFCSERKTYIICTITALLFAGILATGIVFWTQYPDHPFDNVKSNSILSSIMSVFGFTGLFASCGIAYSTNKYYREERQREEMNSYL